MLMMQDTSTDVMCFYDGGLGFSDYRSLFSADSGKPYRTYYSLAMFNSLYKLSNQVKTECNGNNLFVNASKNDKKAVIVISNANESGVDVSLDILGYSKTDAQFARIDTENRYTITGEVLGDTVFMPPYSCLEIKLWDI